MAILLVEQYYDFARSLADQYVVMSRGEVIKAGQGRRHGRRRRARLPDRLTRVNVARLIVPRAPELRPTVGNSAAGR